MNLLDNPLAGLAILFGTIPLILMTGVLVVVQAGIVLFAPFAGLIAGRIAHKKGLSATRFSCIGFVYVLMLGLPWLFLVFGLNGRNVSGAHMRLAYKLVYGLWGISIAGLLGTYIAVGRHVAPFLLILLLASIGGWIVSWQSLNNYAVVSPSEWGDPNEGRVPYFRYVQPFAWGMLFIVLSIASGVYMLAAA